jgi:SAM-dependent methyltransferase
MEVPPYATLAPYYHSDWSGFSKSYIALIERLGIGPKGGAATALDVACGTGTLAAALSEAGFAVLGVDISPQMLDIARKAFPAIDFIRGDMRDIGLDRRFDLITCSFDSLNYLLTLDDVRKAFRRISDHLVPGGHFLFDVNTARLYEDKQHGTIHRSIHGVEFEQQLFYDPTTRRSRTVFVFPGGDTEEHVQRPYEPAEVEEALSNTGLRVVRSFVNERLDPADDSAYKVYFLTQKRERESDSESFARSSC